MIRHYPKAPTTSFYEGRRVTREYYTSFPPFEVTYVRWAKQHLDHFYNVLGPGYSVVAPLPVLPCSPYVVQTNGEAQVRKEYFLLSVSNQHVAHVAQGVEIYVF